MRSAFRLLGKNAGRIPGNFLDVLDRVHYRCAASQLIVLATHYYPAGEGERFDEKDVSDCLRYLNDECRVLPLSEAMERLQDEKSLPRRAVSLVVDDAALDFYRLGWPLLKNFPDLPFSLSVVPGLIASPDSYQPIAVLMRGVMKSLGSDKDSNILERAALWLGLDELEKARFSPEDLFSRVIELDSGATLELLEHLDLPHEEFMTWEQLSELGVTGRVEFCSHSMSHPRFRYVSGEWLDWEIKQSKRLIEANLDVAVDTFVFPYGGRKEVTEEVRQSMKKHGYRFALLTVPGVVTTGSDRFLLPRMPGEVTLGDLQRNTNGFLAKFCFGDRKKSLRDRVESDAL